MAKSVRADFISKIVKARFKDGSSPWQLLQNLAQSPPLSKGGM